MKNSPALPRKSAVAAVDTDEQVRKNRPLCTATIDPVGPRGGPTREHLIKIVLELDLGKAEAALRQAMSIAHKAMSGFAPAEGEADRRAFNELSASRRGKGGVLNVSVVAVESTVAWPDRPATEVIDVLTSVLAHEGYKVVLKERRECSQPGCSTDAMTEWRQLENVPASWFTTSICGKHDFKQCAKCKSIFRLTSTNAAGQSPSVHCEVCGHVLIEWGSSKRWDAELVTRGANVIVVAAPTK